VRVLTHVVELRAWVGASQVLHFYAEWMDASERARTRYFDVLSERAAGMQRHDTVGHLPCMCSACADFVFVCGSSLPKCTLQRYHSCA
jgi:hypothetical protein